MQSLLSISYDGIIRVWQLNNPTPQVYTLQYPPIAAEVLYPVMVIATFDQKVLIMDINQLNYLNKMLFVPSNLGSGSQITGVAISPSRQTVAMCSIDGRANVKDIEKDYTGAYKYSNRDSGIQFKCHKVDQASGTVLYPVSGIGFNPLSQTFLYTCGNNGQIIFWDLVTKNKIKELDMRGNPVTCAQVKPDGAYIAYALGYDWHQGIEGMGRWQPRISAHQITQDELRK